MKLLYIITNKIENLHTYILFTFASLSSNHKYFEISFFNEI